MGKLRYNVAVSLDGFIARRDGSYDWIVSDDSINFAALFAQFDAFIMGRRTFETMQAQGDQNPLKGKAQDRVAVVTTTADLAVASSSAAAAAPAPSSSSNQGYADVTVLRNTKDALAWIRTAKEQFARDIWLFGGGSLCGSLLAEKVVDTVETATMPVILGDGIKMVQTGDAGEGKQLSSTWALRLTGSKALKSGILMCTYDVVYPN